MSIYPKWRYITLYCDCSPLVQPFTVRTLDMVWPGSLSIILTLVSLWVIFTQERVVSRVPCDMWWMIMECSCQPGNVLRKFWKLPFCAGCTKDVCKMLEKFFLKWRRPAEPKEIFESNWFDLTGFFIHHNQYGNPFIFTQTDFYLCLLYNINIHFESAKIIILIWNVIYDATCLLICQLILDAVAFHWLKG